MWVCWIIECWVIRFILAISVVCELVFLFLFPKGKTKKKNNFKTLIRQFGSAEEPQSWKKRVYIRKECDKKNENKKITLIRKSEVNY